MTRKRVVNHAGAAWVAAVAGAWLVAATCRTMQGPSRLPPAAAGGARLAAATVPAPSLRVGILVERRAGLDRRRLRA